MYRELFCPSIGQEYPCAFCEQPAKIGDLDVVIEKFEEDSPDGLFTLSYEVWHRDCLERYYDAGEHTLDQKL